MAELFIIRSTDEDKYGDEYYVYDFVTAHTLNNAFFIAGARLAYSDVENLGGDYFSHSGDNFYADKLDKSHLDYWEAFADDGWEENFMVWAAKNRRQASTFRDFVEAHEDPCIALLELASYRSLVEQYKIEEALINKGTPAPANKKSTL
jgi:hypothetical protein